MKHIALSWSNAKDSAWAPHPLRCPADVEVAAPITTFNSTADRLDMHAVRRTLARLGSVYAEPMAHVCRKA